MKLTRRSVLSTAAVAAAAGTLPSLPARAAGKSLTIGVCSDFSGTYSDIGGETSVACVQQALQDFGAANKGYDVTVIKGDHQNKPDIGAGLARQWFDSGVDLLDRRAEFRGRRSPSRASRPKKTKPISIQTPATSALTGKACNAADHPLDV